MKLYSKNGATNSTLARSVWCCSVQLEPSSDVGFALAAFVMLPVDQDAAAMTVPALGLIVSLRIPL